MLIGIARGTIPEPLLFLIYVNDIFPSIENSCCRLFSDIFLVLV